MTNTGPYTINDLFYVDLRFDGVVAERWTSKGMSVRFFSAIADWDRLARRVKLSPGMHTLTLVVDATGLIPETDETDNEFEAEFTWAPPSAGSPPPTPAPRKLPDLAPFAPEGWQDTLIATSYPGDTADGPLSVDVTANVRFGLRNRGLASTPADVWAYLYLDDLLVDNLTWSGLLADGWAVRPEWAGLNQMTGVEPGVHTLRLVIDPHDLVAESDEGNNVFEKQLTWATGPVPPRPTVAASPVAAPPAPLTLPNLVPGWPFGWDGPIIVSSEGGTSLDSPLTVADTPFIDVAVFNRSSVAATKPSTVDLYFDDEKVHTFTVGRTSAAVFRSKEDWEGLPSLVQLTAGPHTLRVVIDPEDAVREANEDDNVYERTLVWTSEDDAAGTEITYTQLELREKLAGLSSLLETRSAVVAADGHDRTEDVLDVADAAYYLMTGKSLRDERADLFLLSHDDYLAWIDDDFDEEFAVKDESQHASILTRRERAKMEFLGFTTRRFGTVAVVVDAERTAADVLGSLAHELGHMRQDLLNPAQTEADQSLHLSGVQEAGAQQFERAFWLAIEEFAGLKVLTYPDYDDYGWLIDNRLDFWLRNADSDEHWLGALLQWLAVLDDPDLADLTDELAVNGRLSAASALELYQHFVDMPPEDAQAYVETRIGALDRAIGTILSTAKGRLVAGLHPDGEGPPELRLPGLLMP